MRLLQFIATLSLLSVVAVSSSGLPAGELAQQWQWLAYSGGVYVILTGLSLCVYRWIPKAARPDYAHVVVWSLILLAGWEATLGLRQLYGFAYSNHSLFALTGSFFNPGPYSGYLAMIFPLCLSEYYRLKEASKSSLPARGGYYIAIAVLLLILCVLPAGMSRSAWLGAGVSGLFVAGCYNNWFGRLKVLWENKRRKVIAGTALTFACLSIGLAAIFYLKKDSANGRLFMWKIGLHAVAEHPIAGHGYAGFPAAYGNAQEAYFAAGRYSDWEEHVAGSPEYAFNEYLHFAIEWGLPALLLCVAVIGFCFWQGFRRGRIGVCGGLLSLAVFAFSSYPLQLPAFIVSFFVLLFACVVGTSRRWLVSMMVVVFLGSLYLWKNNDYAACKKWTRVSMLYNMGAYESAREDYAALYPALKDRREFMFEYGRCLQKLGEYDASNRILQETALLTCDPMVFNLMAKNHQLKGEYEKAEEYLLRSINRLPGRIYPYYLLAKLYAEPDFCQPEKFRSAARMVMEKEPKVQSTAIREMREEIRMLYTSAPEFYIPLTPRDI